MSTNAQPVVWDDGWTLVDLGPGSIGDAVLSPVPGLQEGGSRQQLAVFACLAAVCGGILLFFRSVGMITLGGGICAILLLLVTFVRVEIGLMALAATIPFEWHLQITERLTAVKVLGYVVAFAGVVRVLTVPPLRWPRGLKVFFAMCIWLTLSMVWNLQHELALRGWLTQISNFVMVYLLFRYCSRPQTLKVLMTVVVASCAAAGLWSLLAGAGIGAEMASGRGELYAENANTFARFMFPGIFLSLALLAEYRGTLTRSMLAGASAVCLVALLFSVSRSATAGVFLGLAVGVLALRRIRLLHRVGFIVLVMVVVGASLLLVASLGVGEAWELRMQSATQGGSSLETRLQLWQKGLRVGLSNPIFGVGPGNEETGFYDVGTVGTVMVSHSDYVASFAEGGLPGMVLFFALCVYWWLSAWRLPAGLFRSAMIGFTVSFLVASAFNPGMPKKILWLALGLCLCAGVVHRRRLSASGLIEEGASSPST